MSDWRKDLLKSINAPVTPQNLKFLAGWQRWEGGHTKNAARFNWLNTTRDAPGVVKSINSVGVKAFDKYQNGIRATAMTLMNGRYDDIVAGLVGGNPYKRDLSAGLSTWVSGSPTGNLKYAQKVMGGSAAPKAAQAQAGRGPKGNPGLAAPPPSAPWGDGGDYDKMVNDIWGGLAPLFRSAFEPVPASVGTGSYAESPGAPGALVTGGKGWGGSQEIASQIASYARKAGLVVSSQKRSTKHTASGGVSDHWTGSTGSYAFDLSGTKSKMDAASKRVHDFLGLTHTPGRWTEITRNGYRIQVGWRVPGHYDHIHIGVRKV